MGPRNDVPAILRACRIGVLSSASEGLPLALLEYGKHGLAAVSTAVGQCPEVLDNGYAGVLVPASSPDQFSDAIVGLLDRSRPARAVRRAISKPGRGTVQSAPHHGADLRCLRSRAQGGTMTPWRLISIVALALSPAPLLPALCVRQSGSREANAAYAGRLPRAVRQTAVLCRAQRQPWRRRLDR